MGLQSDIARKYRTKNPDVPTLTLARRMYKANKKVFMDLDGARGALRRIEGKSGEKAKKSLKDKTLVKADARPYNPFKLPDSFEEKKAPFKLPLTCDNILVISDLHIPYHNISAVTAALDYGKKQKINTIFINGDLIDFHKISRFQQDPEKRDVKEELEAVRQFLASLRKLFPNADIYWLMGNHDNRFNHYMLAKAPELLDIEEFSLANICHLDKYNVKLLNDKTLVKMGKLSVSHGHLIIRGIFAPVNAARGVYMKTKQSTMIGHCHKVSEHSETDMDGNLVTCYSSGCLCELAADYNPLVHNNAHGFAHVRVKPNGHYRVRNFRILNGEIL